jgi:ADP-heptose:LPS heptosyltransferase
MAIPLVLWCKKQAPDARVTLFIDERAAELKPFIVGPDEIAVIPGKNAKYWPHCQMAWKQRKKNFNLAISAKSSPMKLMNFFLYSLRADKRIAYTDQKWHSKLVNFPVPYDPASQKHQALRSLHLVDPELKEVPSAFYPQLNVDSGFSLEAPTLLISVTNNRLGSTLDHDKYHRLLNTLFLNKRFSVIVNGEPKDCERAGQLAQGLKMPCRVVMTERLEEFLKLLASVDAVFIGDGGVMHLAAALGKKQVVLFGGTKVWEWAPLSDRAVCLADEHNVNFISEEKILEALHELW